ncbi:MAG: N-6 DNA methylase [Dehalococcoidia bacterium]|nr:N-6 DNA methylase [Dehalococcoidia bacterium]
MTEDKDISTADVQTLSTRDSVSAFFATLGYRTDSRQPQDVSAMGITAESLSRQIKYIERVAVHDDGAEPLDLYLIELNSVTVAATQGLARSLRNRVGNFLLVLTDDYERLDFVLLERSLPSFSTSRMSTRGVTVRPRTLTVSRRDPSQVQLRVLRRFTYTEADSDAQYDKLLSAYTVAEWSEPLFNNRALFSDYYLNERLPELAEWKERPEAVYHRLRELTPRLRYTEDGATKGSPIESALQALGFRVDTATGGDAPDFRLYSPDNPDKPVAVCISYPWNRYLDGRDETRDAKAPDENPGARVVTILESGEAPWAIVTNGKLWRLYSARTHSRSTNYYEVDLHETLAMTDPNEAFRYFWLFFRMETFVTSEIPRDGRTVESCFLDRILDESESYAKGLGERLKERVFERVFPHFAAGFIEHLRGQVGMAGSHQPTLLPVSEQLALKREPHEEFRRQVFNGTLTLLYRLLFLLYAESRDLLPVREARGYWQESLTKLKADIAERAGNIEDDVPVRLKKAYRDSADATELYDRLLALFSVIDLGTRDLNVPLYNGGLFVTNPDGSDRSQEGETARFLESHKIPDRYLALGLDLLSRDTDDKRQDLVFIDYKSLGVRQLGSIYEGLLEFKVRIAQEKMAVVKGRKTEEVIPYEEAVQSNRKVLTIGRGKNAKERVYRPGDVYLENDRRERKATGSYYTPEHIVKYIVENTVGPVLSEKFDRLRPKFREAGGRYRQKLREAEAFRKQGKAPDDPAKIANTYEGLVDDLFDLKVLDPAMGSGHFLVEAVDFICDRILGEREGFLRAFPWNPVTKFLQDTREAIIAEMDRQGVTVDTGRLTDINLLKRHVLKRCVYGVDLNPMAVELAKVSLWLDCFTIGAPLSFLDHHLKCGNSLIGTTVQEVESELAMQRKGHVADLFGGPFQGLLAATATIEQLRRIPDATAGQAEESRQLFAKFEEAQDPYKSALNIWVSQHFGNKLAKEYLTLAGSDLVDQIRSGGQGLLPEYQEAISLGDRVSDEKRFFHWDLEFPEAFVDLVHSTWKGKNEQGFDAVVGNPPYDELSEHAAGRALPEKDYIKGQPLYADALGGRLNVFRPFILRAMTLLVAEGHHSFIVPMALLGDNFTARLRRHLVTSGKLRSVVAFPQKDDPTNRIFLEAKLSTCLYVLENRKNRDHDITVETYPGNSLLDSPKRCSLVLGDIKSLDESNLPIPPVSHLDIARIRQIDSFGKVAKWHRVARCYLGELMSNRANAHLFSDRQVGPEVLRGANINRYILLDEPKQGDSLYLREAEFLRSHQGDARITHHEHEKVGFQQSSPIDNWRRIIASHIPAGRYCKETVQYFTQKDCLYDLYTILAIFNSELIEWRFSLTSTNNHVNRYEIDMLPIPRFKRLHRPSHDQAKPRNRWTAMLTSDVGDPVSNWENAVAAEISGTCREIDTWPDSLHDALSASGRELTKLRKSRQELIEGFAEWLFATFKVNREQFTGKTYLQGGQASVDERSLEWLHDLLARNRRACGIDPLRKYGELTIGYGNFVDQVRPCNEKFLALDQATTKVVWQLVGLNSDGSVP